MNDSREVFRLEFLKWVDAHNEIKGFNAQGAELYAEAEKRIPESIRSQIGEALAAGVIRTEAPPGRGYAVRESDRAEELGGLYMISHWGGGKIMPCWELYVQLADYHRLRSAPTSRDVQIRLEDRQMDITVWAGNEFLLCIENKETKPQALGMLAKMRAYGESGFNLKGIDKGNDPLRKAKYLFIYEARPKYFALSAIGYEQLFRIEYLDERNRFRLIECEGGIVLPHAAPLATGLVPPRSLADGLVREMEQFAIEGVWVSPGSGKTAVNVYLPCDRRDRIVLGVYKTGEVWTDFKGLGEVRAARLAECLSEFGISVDTSKEWGFWEAESERFNLEGKDAASIARAVIRAVAPGSESVA